jgi:hypothetical protein
MGRQPRKESILARRSRRGLCPQPQKKSVLARRSRRRGGERSFLLAKKQDSTTLQCGGSVTTKAQGQEARSGLVASVRCGERLIRVSGPSSCGAQPGELRAAGSPRLRCRQCRHWRSVLWVRPESASEGASGGGGTGRGEGVGRPPVPHVPMRDTRACENGPPLRRYGPGRTSLAARSPSRTAGAVPTRYFQSSAPTGGLCFGSVRIPPVRALPGVAARGPLRERGEQVSSRQ